jgi:hypothetical protein
MQHITDALKVGAKRCHLSLNHLKDKAVRKDDTSIIKNPFLNLEHD